MGNNNLCYSKGGMESQMSQLICQTTFHDCKIYLTAGQIEKEQVECIVLPTDSSFSNVCESDKPTFSPQLGQCVFVASQKKSKKNYILAVVQENQELSFQDKQDEERQIIYETIHNSLKMANSRQMKSIGFPVFSSKDHTTSATIMIMAIKLFITEQKIDTVTSIYLTLNVNLCDDFSASQSGEQFQMGVLIGFRIAQPIQIKELLQYHQSCVLGGIQVHQAATLAIINSERRYSLILCNKFLQSVKIRFLNNNIKMKLVVIFCAFIALAAATDAIDIFNTLPKSDYGRTILQTVQLELGNGASTSSVVDSLNDLLNSAEQEKGAIQTNLRNRQQQCQSRQDDAQGVIDKANQKKADDERKLPLINEQLISKQEQALVKAGEEERNNDRLAQLTAVREQQKQEYEARRNELTNYVAALGEAKSIIQGLGSVSFLQVTSNDHYFRFKEANPNAKGYGIMVEMLLKASLQVKTPEQVEKLVATIQGLLDSIFELQKEELLVDDAREVEFIRQREIILIANYTLAAAVASLHAQVLSLQQDLVEVTNDVNTNKQIVTIKTKELNDWVKTCSDEEKNLRAIFESRVGQVEIINQILILFNQSGISSELQKQIAEIQLN